MFKILFYIYWENFRLIGTQIEIVSKNGLVQRYTLVCTLNTDRKMSGTSVEPAVILRVVGGGERCCAPRRDLLRLRRASAAYR